MPEITLEKIHSLLQQLADYVMTEIPIIKQDVAELKQDVAQLKQDVAQLKQDVAQLKQDVALIKYDVALLKQEVELLKQDVEKLKVKVDYIIDGMDAQVKELDTIRTEQAATERTLYVYNERTAELEQRVLGRRVRDKNDD